MHLLLFDLKSKVDRINSYLPTFKTLFGW